MYKGNTGVCYVNIVCNAFVYYIRYGTLRKHLGTHTLLLYELNDFT